MLVIRCKWDGPALPTSRRAAWTWRHCALESWADGSAGAARLREANSTASSAARRAFGLLWFLGTGPARFVHVGADDAGAHQHASQ